MKLLFDTNILLDILLNRKDYVDQSLESMEKALNNGDRLYMSASAFTDVYYILKKQLKSGEMALKGIKRLARIFQFAKVDEDIIILATCSKMLDFEDAVVDAVAYRIKADYIITRNTDDFKESIVKAISPSDFIGN